MSIKISKIILLIAFFCLTTSSAQIQKMSDLSKNKYLGMSTIYDDNGEDVWGYFSLYQKDKTSKDSLELEFVILDKNLNRVGSNTFTQYYLNTWLFEVYPSIGRTLKKQNTLYMALGFFGISESGNYFFRKINLDDFSVSDCEVVIDSEKKIFTKEIKKSEKARPLSNLGRYGYYAYAHKSPYYFKIFDLDIFDIDLNKKWSLICKKDKNVNEMYQVLRVSEKYLVLRKNIKSKETKKKWHYTTIEVFDIENGSNLLTIEREDSNFLYSDDFSSLEGDKFVLHEIMFNQNKKKKRNHAEIVGYSKREFNLSSKKLIQQKILKWDEFKNHLNIDEFGKIDNDFYIHPVGIRTSSDGKTVMAFEGFKPAKNTHILDLYMVELDQEFKIKSFLKVEKFKDKIYRLEAYGQYLRSNNYFDYLYTQNIKGDDFAYFYQDNENEIGSSTNLKANNWVLGIVTYADGQFNQQKINLKTGEGKIYPERAKNGYILLREVTDKETELRLEKINY